MKSNLIKKLDFYPLFSGPLPLFVLAHFMHHLLTALPTPLLPMIRSEFALDYAQSGLLISAFSLSYGIFQLPAGWLADRIGPRMLVTISISGLALAGLLVGFSQTYIMIIVFFSLMGMLGGGYHPASAVVISDSVDMTKRGQVLGLHTIGGSASFFLAPLIAAAIASAWNWRGCFVGLAVPAFIFGFMFYVLLGRQSLIKRASHKINSNHTDIPQAPGHLHRLVAFMILAAFASAIALSITSFIPLYFVDHFGVSNERAAAYMALIFSGGLWAAPLGGYLSDRWGRIPVMVAACFITGPVIYLLNLVPYGFGLIALLVSIGMIMYIQAPVAQAYIVEHAPAHNRTTTLGLYFFAGTEGSGIMTPIIGYLIDRFGFYTTFSIIGAALLAVTIACFIFLRAHQER